MSNKEFIIYLSEPAIEGLGNYYYLTDLKTISKINSSDITDINFDNGICKYKNNNYALMRYDLNKFNKQFKDEGQKVIDDINIKQRSAEKKYNNKNIETVIEEPVITDIVYTGSSINDVIRAFVEIREHYFIQSIKQFWFSTIKEFKDDTNYCDAYMYVRSFTHEIFKFNNKDFKYGKLHTRSAMDLKIIDNIALTFIDNINYPLRKKLYEYFSKLFFDKSDDMLSDVVESEHILFDEISIYYFLDNTARFSGPYYKYTFEELKPLYDTGITETFASSSSGAKDEITIKFRYNRCKLEFFKQDYTNDNIKSVVLFNIDLLENTIKFK